MKKHTILLVPTLFLLALTTFQSLAQSTYEPYTFITLAGLAGRSGSADGTGSAARFNNDSYGGGVAVDSAGNAYVADTGNSTIRKVTSAGVVTTLAGQTGIGGSADGTGSVARFQYPPGVAVDSAGNVYVADTGNSTIRKLTPAGVVTTLAGLAPQYDTSGNYVSGGSGSADGTGSAARFNNPYGVAVDSAGNVYVADTWNNTIRKVTPVGVVTTLAGQAGTFGSLDGTGSAARFGIQRFGEGPTGVAVDGAGNVYVADQSNQTIRKVTPSGVVTTLAGLAQLDAHGNPIGGSADGTGSAARFDWPSSVAVDGAGNVYVADSGSETIRKVTPAGVVTTLAGLTSNSGSADGTGSAAQFNYPSGVAVDNAGNVYVVDTQNNTIRKGFPAVRSPLILTQPQSQTVTATYDVTFSVFANGAPPLSYQWRKGGATLAGATNASYTIVHVQAIDADVYSVVVSNLYGTATSSNAVLTATSPYTFITLAGPGGSGVAVDSAGNVYVAETYTIEKVTTAGVVTTLAGLAPRYDASGNLISGGSGSEDGMGSAARFSFSEGSACLAVDSAGNVYVADTYNYTVRKVTPAGVVTTLAGLAGSPGSADGTNSDARFWFDDYGGGGLAVDRAGSLYVADLGNSAIRKLTPMGTNWVVTTLAGGGNQGSADGAGSAAQFQYPSGVAVDSADNVYVADSGNGTIRKVTPAGVVTTIAGQAGTSGSTDGTGGAARFDYPLGLAVDSLGNLYVVDSFNITVRKVTPMGTNWFVTTLGGLAGSGGSADGTGSAARFGFVPNRLYGAMSDYPGGPSGVAVDSAGNLYVADTFNGTIRKGFLPVGPPVILTQPMNQTVSAMYPVSISAVVIGALPLAYQWRKDGTNIAGATSGTFTIANAQSIDTGAYLVVISNALGSITSSNAAVIVEAGFPYTFTTIAGLAGSQGSADGTGSAARFFYPSGAAVDSAGNVYVADSFNATIRKVTPAAVVTTLAGEAGNWGSADGTGNAARFYHPAGVAVDSAGNVYVADSGNNTIRKVTSAGVVTTLAGLAQLGANGSPVFGSADGTGSAARFYYPAGVAVGSAGNLYVADGGNNTIRQVTPAAVVTTLAGEAGNWGSADGTGNAARFNNPQGVAVDSAGNVYVADSGNNTIRKVTPSGVVTTLAGLAQVDTWGNPVSGSTDGTGSAARFNFPYSVALDTSGSVYVADQGNNTIRKVTSGGVVTTLAGLAQLDANGSPVFGSADGTGSAARFYNPVGVAVDSAGDLYIADNDNNTIRKGYWGYPPPVLLTSGSGFGFNAGHFGFNLTGPAGQPVIVEASTDLENWLPIWTNTSTLSFSDPQSGAFSRRFYRARTP